MNIINGNILDITEGIIVHQVNCKGIMGAGLAKQIKDRYPEVYEKYLDWIEIRKELGQSPLGSIMNYFADSHLIICNMFSQYSYGRNDIYTNYEAFEKCLIQLNEDKNTFRDEYRNPPIYFPYGIGCGLAGGDWNIISKLIDKYFPEAIIVKYN